MTRKPNPPHMRVKPKPFEIAFDNDSGPSPALLTMIEGLTKARTTAKGRGYHYIRRESRSLPERQYYREVRRMRIPTHGVKLILWTQQNGRCQYCCGSLLPRFHVDHIHPKSQGGRNHLSNYRLACEACNLTKRTQSAESFALSLLLDLAQE